MPICPLGGYSAKKSGFTVLKRKLNWNERRVPIEICWITFSVEEFIYIWFGFLGRSFCFDLVSWPSFRVVTRLETCNALFSLLVFFIKFVWINYVNNFHYVFFCSVASLSSLIFFFIYTSVIKYSTKFHNTSCCFLFDIDFLVKLFLTKSFQKLEMDISFKKRYLWFCL